MVSLFKGRYCCGPIVSRLWRISSLNKSTTSSTSESLDPAVESYLATHLHTSAVDPTRQRLFVQVIQSLEPIYGKNQVNVSHLQSFGISGLQDLLNAVVRNDANEEDGATHPSISVRFAIPHHKTEFTLPWYYKHAQFATLLDLVKAPPPYGEKDTGASQVLSEYVEAACGGNASCSTCHVYIDTASTSAEFQSRRLQLSSVSEAEQDMLDYAFDAQDASRLACQVRVLDVVESNPDDAESSTSSAPLQLTVVIPAEANNLWK